MWQARVFVTLKEGVFDPQGKAVQGGLRDLGYDCVADLRIGKFILLGIDVPERKAAEALVREMCDKLLANPVIEEYSFELVKR